MSLASRALLRPLHFKHSRTPYFVTLGRRYASSSTHTATPVIPRRRFGTFVTGGLLALLGLGVSPYLSTRIQADAESDGKKQTDSSSLSSLIRTYAVYSMCSVPAFVDASPKLLGVLTSIPLVKQVTELFVRITFFDQFVGGDTALETVPLLRTLRSNNKGALFAYSIEVDESEAVASSPASPKKGQPIHKRIVDEMVHCIDVAADFEDSVGNAQTGRRTWVAVKMTALLPNAQSLVNLSSYLLKSRKPLPVPFPGCPRSTDLDILYTEKPSSGFGSLTPDDISSLRELHSDLRRICLRAQQRGVKIILDAEYSWYQPAIDAMQLSLMREFNKYSQEASVQPLIYGTYQAYLRRTPSHLEQSFIDAKENNYTLGVKLVRGAYHPHETAAYEARLAGRSSLSISPEPHPPVWATKEETDACYNQCAKVLIRKIKEDIQNQAKAQTSILSPVKWFKRTRPNQSQQIGVLFGTHNWDSSKLILKELVDTGLAEEGEGGVVNIGDEVTERLTLGQLYGMSDALSDYLVQKTRSNAPMVIKYVPYGALSEVMPYLSRRAIENKSVLGNGAAAEERRSALKQIRAKILG